VRKFTQDSSKAVQQTQDDLLGRGLMTEVFMSDCRMPRKQMDKSARGDLGAPETGSGEASSASGERTRSTVENLKRGVERAAESVLGDDTEALKLAKQRSRGWTAQLQREIAQGQGAGFRTGPEQVRLKHLTRLEPMG